MYERRSASLCNNRRCRGRHRRLQPPRKHHPTLPLSTTGFLQFVLGGGGRKTYYNNDNNYTLVNVVVVLIVT